MGGGGIRRDIGGKKSVFARGLRDFGRVWKWERKIGALGLDGTEIWRKRPDRSFFPVFGGKSVWRSNALNARMIGVRMPGAQRVSAVGDQKKAWRIPICRTPDCSSTKALQTQY